MAIIQIEKRYKPWLIHSNRRPSGPRTRTHAGQCPMLDTQAGIIVASDGYVLAIIPVTITNGDKLPPQLFIGNEIFEQAWKGLIQAGRSYYVEITETNAGWASSITRPSSDKTEMLNISAPCILPGESYETRAIDWVSLVTKMRHRFDESVSSNTFRVRPHDEKTFKALTDALGCRAIRGSKAHMLEVPVITEGGAWPTGTETLPMLVFPNDFAVGDGFGMIMPLTLSRPDPVKAQLAGVDALLELAHGEATA